MFGCRFIVILLLAVLMCSQLQALDRNTFLEAVRMKENSTGRGKSGELGPYQMMPKTVKDAGGYDKVSAMFHLKWLERRMSQRGVDINVFNLALCWNAGFERATTGKAKEVSYQYAVDVLNLYEKISRAPPSSQQAGGHRP